MTERLYGGWRPARGMGIGRLSQGQTISVIIAFGVLLITFLAVGTLHLPWMALGVVAAATGLFTALAVIPAPRYGMSVGGAALVMLRTLGAQHRGETTWESGPLTTHPRGHELPGVLGPLLPVASADGLGRPYGLLWDRRTGRYTVGLWVSPVGTVLSAAEQTDVWVANWGEWLAALGHEPALCWVTVTIETAPGAGTAMTDYISAAIDPTSPQEARRILTEIAASHSGATADVSSWVSITLDPYRSAFPPADTGEAVAECSRVVSGLENTLGLAGVATLGRIQEWQWAHLIRAAFDPDARAGLTRLSEQQERLAWREAAPVRAAESLDHYQHDSGYSCSFALSKPAEQHVASDVLAPLLVPGRHHRRVCLTYQAIPADEAAKTVEKELDYAGMRKEGRRRFKLNESARTRADEARAKQAATEEAHGAGVELWSAYITTTVTDPRRLPDAISDVEKRSRSSKLTLRRCWSWQAAGFAASLGAGIYPPELSHRGVGKRS